MTTSEIPPTTVRMVACRRALAATLLLWGALLIVGGLSGPSLSESWPGWGLTLGAAAVWGLTWLIVFAVLRTPLRASEVPLLTAGFGLLMTILGWGAYWATVQLYPTYRVPIESAAWMVAVCMAVTVGSLAAWSRFFGARKPGPALVWNWSRVRLLSIMIGGLAAIGTVVTIGRIGYLPILTGDPTSARVEFPAIGGIWFRLSMLGGVAAVLVAVQAAARRATPSLYLLGATCLGMVGMYGARFFVVLPLGIGLLLWDRMRAPLPFGRVAVAVLVALPAIGALGFLRERDTVVLLLGPVGLALYGTLGEFRDLAWALDFYGASDQHLLGATGPGVVVGLVPAILWSVVGIDKAALFGQNSASILAQEMGRSTGQRIGAYGEFFMNFGWSGALIGAAVYGALMAYLHTRFRTAKPNEVRSVFLAVAIAAAVFAQIGQLNMFTATLSGFGYPLLLVALVASERRLGDLRSA